MASLAETGLTHHFTQSLEVWQILLTNLKSPKISRTECRKVLLCLLWCSELCVLVLDLYGSCFISFFSFSCLVEIFVVISSIIFYLFGLLPSFILYFLLVALFFRSFGTCFLLLLPFLFGFVFSIWVSMSVFSCFLVAKYVACFLVMLLGYLCFYLSF